MHKTIKCPACGELFPLPSGKRNSHLNPVFQHDLASRPEVLRAADLALDPANYEVSRAGKEIALNLTEFRLLKSLMKGAGRVIFRKTLFHSIWNSNDNVDENLLDVTISHLRKKVDRNHEVKLIRRVRNVGYSIRDPAKTR